MPVHPDAVANAMAEEFVVGTEAGVFNHLARGRVDRLARNAGTSSI